MQEQEQILPLVDRLSIEEIDQLITVISGQSDCEGFSLMVQLNPNGRAKFFSGDAAPLSSDLIPMDNFAEKRSLYLAIAKRLISEWNKDRTHGKNLHRLDSFMTLAVYDLYNPAAARQMLQEYGYDVDPSGLATEINAEFSSIIERVALTHGIDLSSFEKKIGGRTLDVLNSAKANLLLTDQEYTFIEECYLAVGASNFGKTNIINKLRILQESRKFFFDAGIELNDLMQLWRINGNYQSITQSLFNEALNGESKKNLLTSAIASVGKSSCTEAEAFAARAASLALPTELPTEEEISTRNEKIVEEVQQIMHYEELLGRSGLSPNLVLYSGPGASQRPYNFAYLTKGNWINNLQVIHAYTAEQRLRAVLGHEFTHEIQAALINSYAGIHAWDQLNIGIKEQLAQAAEDSMNATYQIKSENKDASNNTLVPKLVIWYQYVFGYCQQRFLEEVYSKNCTMSDEELLALEEKITTEIHEFNLVTSDGNLLDLTRIRRMQAGISASDGVMYTIHELNKQAAMAVAENNPSSSTLSAAPQLGLKDLLVQRWGEDWILNKTAYKYFVCVMIESKNCEDTTATSAFLAQLIKDGDEKMEAFLKQYNIVIH